MNAAGGARARELPEAYSYTMGYMVLRLCERLTWLNPGAVAAMSAEDQATLLAYESIRQREEARDLAAGLGVRRA